MSSDVYTLAQGIRERNVGPRSDLGSFSSLRPCLCGSVMAQFSHGPARFVTLSSYVLRKLLDSRRGAGCSDTLRGLSGGVSMADAEGREEVLAAGDEALRSSAARDIWASCSDMEREEFRWPCMFILRIASAMAAVACPTELGTEVGALVGGRSWSSASSKHVEQGAGRPSVTINGVGP